MSLIRYRPLFDLTTEFRTLQDELNRLLQENAPLPQLGFVPAAELSETNEALHLHLELPGINKEDVNVEVTLNSVRVSGERKTQNHSESQGMKRSEFRYGAFERVISLPVEVVNTEVVADYTNGILHLTLPKRMDESQKAHKVQW